MPEVWIKLILVSAVTLYVWLVCRPIAMVQDTINSTHDTLDLKNSRNLDSSRTKNTISLNMSKILSQNEINKLENGATSQLDDNLAILIAKKWMIRPSYKPYALNDNNKVYHSQLGQDQVVNQLLGNRTNGFFVECGAASGEYLSNTLFFEKHLNWTGLLIEANKEYIRNIMSKNRRAYVISSCLSINGRAGKMKFLQAADVGGLKSTLHSSWKKYARSLGFDKYQNVQCFPLFSLLYSLNANHVDYLSLDIEGAEMDVLKLFPWKQIVIDVISIEYRVGTGHTQELKRKTLLKLRTIQRFFQMLKDYTQMAILPGGKEATGIDVIFARNDVIKNSGIP